MLDFCKTFGKVLCKKYLTGNLSRYCLGEKVLRCTNNWQRDRKQGRRNWEKSYPDGKMLSGDFHWSVLGSVMFNVFRNDTENGTVRLHTLLIKLSY